MDPKELEAKLAAETARADAEKARADAAQVKLDAFPPKAKDESADEEGDGEDKPAFLKKKMAKKDSQIARLEGELVAAKNDAADARIALVAAEKARTDAAAGSMAAARARIALETKAGAILGAEFKADASDRDLMIAVVKRVDGEDVTEECSMDYVRGLYAGAAKRHDGGGEALAGLRLATVNTSRADASIPDEDAARAKMHADSANAWKGEGSK